MSSMSTTTGAFAPKRPATLTWAIYLIVGFSILGLGFFFLPGADEIPAGAIVIGVVSTVLTVFLSWFAWQLKRWAVIGLTVINVLNLLSSIPGLFNPPSDAIMAALILSLPITAIPLWLLWHPESRKAYR